MKKSPDAFRSIGEVARLVGVAPHVLRYWEGQFAQLSPVKRADGRRYYRPEDVQLAAGLCEVMRDEGLTIRGAKLLIAADRGAGLRARGVARLKDGGALEFGGDAEEAAAQERSATTAESADPVPPTPAPLPVAQPVDDAGALLRRLSGIAIRLRAQSEPLRAGADAVAQDLRDLLARH